MKYWLDTNICIYLLKQRPPQVARRFAECYEGEVVISAVTLAELRYGVRSPLAVPKFHESIDSIAQVHLF